MQIYGPFRVSTTQASPGVGQSSPPSPGKPAEKASATPVDQLDLSSSSSVQAAGVNRLSHSSPVAGGGEIRIDKVADLRRQIAEGNYDTPEKMDAALDRLLDQIA